MRRGGPLKRRTPLRAVGAKGQRDRREVDTARTELLFRSQGRCETRGYSPLCTGYGIHAHHVIRRSQGGHNNANNLLWVCSMCHRKIHDNPAEALRRGYLRPGGETA